MFRPTNSSESNLFTIRVALGFGSTLDVFNTGANAIANNAILASNSSGNPTTVDHLASPTSNNLPSGFYIQYSTTGPAFRVYYGKSFTSQPCINVVPTSNNSSTFLAIPYIVKSSLLFCDILFNNTTTSVPPSANGTTGLLGFDLVITGAIKIGATTGNSNKGWALSDSTNADPTSVYSYMDVNLGSGFTATDSVVVSKNLKLIGSDNTIKTYSTSTSSLDYTQTVWIINTAVNLTTLTPQKGMVLIITAGSPIGTSPTVVLAASKSFGYAVSGNTTLTFSTAGATVTLYGIDTTRFVIVSQTSGVTLS